MPRCGFLYIQIWICLVSYFVSWYIFYQLWKVFSHYIYKLSLPIHFFPLLIGALIINMSSFHCILCVSCILFSLFCPPTSFNFFFSCSFSFSLSTNLGSLILSSAVSSLLLNSSNDLIPGIVFNYTLDSFYIF